LLPFLNVTLSALPIAIEVFLKFNHILLLMTSNYKFFIIHYLKTPKIETSTSSAFRVVHANAFFGGLNPVEGRIVFYTDILEPQMKTGGNIGEMELERINRERQVDIRLSPMDFVNLAAWMNAHIKRLEEKGIIKKADLKPKQADYSV
jgi:hypothetical protein